MSLGFNGEVVDFYHRYRRGYPPAAIDAIVEAFELTGDDIVVDLGCGTGQLAVPIANRVRAVVGFDPEPDMLSAAQRAAADAGTRNMIWMLGSDIDMPALGRLLGARSLGAVTIAQALHWMDRDNLFAELALLTRPDGGVAVVTNGTPLWLQNTDWSLALRRYMEDWLGTTLSRTCGTDRDSQRRYHRSLEAAGFTTEQVETNYTAALDFDQIIGGVYSALPADKLPPAEDRHAFANGLRHALPPGPQFAEHIRVTILLGRNQPPRSRRA